MTSRSRATPKAATFEAHMKRLDEIIDILEEGNKPLDETVTMYEEGIRLSKTCMEYLDQTELRLKKLVKEAGGTFELQNGSDE